MMEDDGCAFSREIIVLQIAATATQQCREMHYNTCMLPSISRQTGTAFLIEPATVRTQGGMVNGGITLCCMGSQGRQQRDPWALEYAAPEHLKADREILPIAAIQHGGALQYEYTAETSGQTVRLYCLLYPLTNKLRGLSSKNIGRMLSFEKPMNLA